MKNWFVVANVILRHASLNCTSNACRGTPLSHADRRAKCEMFVRNIICISYCVFLNNNSIDDKRSQIHYLWCNVKFQGFYSIQMNIIAALNFFNFCFALIPGDYRVPCCLYHLDSNLQLFIGNACSYTRTDQNRKPVPGIKNKKKVSDSAMVSCSETRHLWSSRWSET